MSFNLKNFRENSLKMTQTEFANLIGVRQDMISRLEKNPEQISLQLLQTIAERTGMTLDQLVSYEKPIPKALKVKPTWNGARYVKETITDYIENYCEQHPNLEKTLYCSLITELQDAVEKGIRKPKVVFVGRSDSGKSTMINALIGKEKMPTNWTPTTSIIVYIKHINDRPSYIGEELWIMKKGKSGIGWDDSRLNDEKYCREWKIAGGNAEMLATYGTRHGESYHSDSVGSAVLFVDSDILKNCDLLDVPGFTGGVVSDNIAARDAKFKADILVYLSQASGFMGSEDFSYLKDSLKTIGVIENKNNPEVKPLSNIFVVATQAHIIDHGNNKKIKEILDDGCERFSDTLTEKFWKDRSSVSGMRYSKSDLRARFFSYTTDIALIRKDFEDNLKTIIEQMPELIKNQAIKLVKDICGRADETLEHEVEKYQNIISEREKYVQLLDEIEKNEPSRIARTTDEKTDIMREISKCSNRARKKFAEKYNEILSESHVVNLIDQKGYKSKKEDMQRLSSYINSELEDALNETLTIESKKFSDRVERFISEYDKRCKVSGVEIQGIDMTDFNAKRAFAAGLSGVAVYGGLAFWASTLGNLGAYILVAKGVSLLSAIGISVGGTAAAVSTVAAIGGPVVLGIAIAAVAALGVFGIFSGGWKKRVAKKLKNAYEEQDALLKYNNCIDEFWEDTETAFIAATEKMEDEWQTYVNDLREKLNNYNIEELKQCVSQAEKTKDFFGNIPL